MAGVTELTAIQTSHFSGLHITFHRTFRSAAVPGRLVLLHSELNCKTLAAE